MQVEAFVPGLYARSEALVQATRDLDRGRTSADAVDQQVDAAVGRVPYVDIVPRVGDLPAARNSDGEACGVREPVIAGRQRSPSGAPGRRAGRRGG